MTVPPARQCCLPECEREAADPAHGGALCQSHLDGDDDAEPVTKPDESPDSTPGDSSSQKTDTGAPASAWEDADFSDPTPGVWPPELLEREQWMGHVDKKPFAPWGDRDHPDADPDDDARWKWGITDLYVDGDTVAIAEDDHRLDGRAFLQQEADPYAFVDGDDVRDPETGDVHPAFIDALEQLGHSYADVSTSSAGVHVYYRGGLPDGVKQAAWELDTEPWGSNDDLPSIEIYAGKHVCAATGEHVPGTPTEIREWDADALEALLDEQGQLPDSRPDVEAARERFDLENYEPSTTTSSETTDDIRDVFAALDRLDAQRVADRTIVGSWNDDASTSDGKRAFIPTWGSRSDNGTANIVDDQIWQDTGSRGGYGGPVVMALIHAGDLSDRGAAPSDAHGALWWQGVEHLRDLGFDIPEYTGSSDDGDLEHVAVLPETPVERADRNVWDWKDAGTDRDDTDPLTTARQRTQDVLEDALDTYQDRVLVEALPTLGKSSGVIRAAAATDEPITVLTGRGRKEQYEQFEQWCDEQGLSSKTLPAFTHDCPTARGDHGDDWKERVLDWYRRGATPQDIHKYAEQELGRPLPCQATEDGQPHDCEYAHKWNFDPDSDGEDGERIDVLLGHYAHAHKPKVVEGRTIVFDEFPASAYETELGGRLQGAVTQFLQRHDELPFSDYTDLIERRSDDQARADALAWFLDDTEGVLRRDPDEVFAGQAGHAAAPIATFALLAGDDLGNGWEHSDLSSSDTDALENAAAVFNREQGTVRILDPPALEYTRGVVGLDGTPTVRMWRRALGAPSLQHRPVLSEGERREYIEDGLGLQLVPTTDAVKPYNNPDYVSAKQDAALLEAVRDRHGEKPGVITSTTALHEYDASDAVDVEWDPQDGLGASGLIDETAYHGNVLGSNEFGEKRVGAIIGSTHYGDGFIKKWAAYDGESVERNDEKGADLSYGDVGDEILTHMREHQTLQAAMRFGRDGNGAAVYIHTNTLPDWVPTAGEGRVLSTWSDGLRQVIDALSDLGAATTAEIAAHPGVDVGKRQVFDHLETLRSDLGVLERHQDTDDGRRVVWRDGGVARLNEHGDVQLEDVSLDDLGADEVRELARSSLYTWEFMNFDGDSGDSPGGGDVEGVATDGGVSIGGDPPPR